MPISILCSRNLTKITPIFDLKKRLNTLFSVTFRPKRSPQNGHIEPRRMAKPPRVPMGSVVNENAPVYGVWLLYTHLEPKVGYLGQLGTAAFFILF